MSVRSAAYLLAGAILVAPQIAAAQEPLTVCDVDHHPDRYLGAAVTVRGAIVDASPNGLSMVGPDKTGGQICRLSLGTTADGGSVTAAVLEPAARLTGHNSKNTAWATVTGTYILQHVPNSRSVGYAASDAYDRYVIDRVTVRDFTLGASVDNPR